jgi:hypothetical protein
MDLRSTARGSLVAGGLAFVGGLVVVVATFLPWFDVTVGGTSHTITGASIGLGWWAFLGGLLLGAAGGALLYYAGWHSLAWSILAIVLGFLVLLVGIRLLADTDDLLVERAVADIAEFYDVPDPAAAEAGVQAALADGTMTADAGSGAWVLLVGAALAIAGGAVGVPAWVTRRRHWVAPTA